MKDPIAKMARTIVGVTIHQSGEGAFLVSFSSQQLALWRFSGFGVMVVPLAAAIIRPQHISSRAASRSLTIRSQCAGTYFALTLPHIPTITRLPLPAGRLVRTL